MLTVVLLVCWLVSGASLALAKPPDRQPPTVRITQPTTASTYTTSSAAVTVSGTASDNRGIVRVQWSTDRGQQGLATGTTTWSFPLTLLAGTTRLTVQALDARGNRGSAVLTLMLLTPPPPPPPVTHEIAWAYRIPVPAQVAIDQCTQTAQGCPMQQIAVVPGSQQGAVFAGLVAQQRYCWVVRSLDQGEVSNRVCSV